MRKIIFVTLLGAFLALPAFADVTGLVSPPGGSGGGGSGITQLTGDVQAGPGSGSVPATVSKVSGSAGTPTTITTYNATSGTITISPPTGALGTIDLTWPDVTGILPVLTGTITTGDCAKFASATSIEDAGAACGSGSMVYPGAGIAVSTGTAWGTSINGGSNTIVGNAGSGQAALTAAQAIAVLNSQTCNPQTGTTYTLVIGDENNCTTMSNAAANTLTVPANASVAFPVGTGITVEELGAGFTTVSPASGVTFESPQFGSSSTQGYPLGGAYGQIQLSKVATDTWLITKYAPGPGSFTLSGTCTTSASTGNAYAGTITLSSAGGCTIIVTPTGVLPAAHSFIGSMQDLTQTAAAAYIPPGWLSADSTTSVTFSVPGSAAASDVLPFTLSSQ